MHNDYDEILKSLPNSKTLEVAQAIYSVYSNFYPINWQDAQDLICEALNLTDDQKGLRQKNGRSNNKVITGRLININGTWKRKKYVYRSSDEYARWVFTENGRSKVTELTSDRRWDYETVDYNDFVVNLAFLLKTAEKIEVKPQEKKDKCTKVVYFIQNTENKKIKIGITINIKSRFGALQGANSSKLHLIGCIPGDESLERELHKKFSQYRGEGEWFTDCVEIYRYIADCDFQGILFK